jgi:hypothetical protein
MEEWFSNLSRKRFSGLVLSFCEPIWQLIFGQSGLETETENQKAGERLLTVCFCIG